jgi:hypothetical protein
MQRSLSYLMSIIVASVICPHVTAAAEGHDPAALGFIKGFSWGWNSGRGDYLSDDAAESMAKLADTGTEWVCISFYTMMPTYDSPEFTWGDANQRMVSDDGIRRAIDLARENGMKVILKPVVNCDDQTWRAWIRFFRPITDDERAEGITGEHDPWGEAPGMRDGMVRDTDKWNTWWNNYEQFVVHYARIAEEKHVAALCLGCEMSSSEEFEDRWRQLIGKVREVYHGQLTYDINHDRQGDLAWWDEVDFMSISAYYQVAPSDGRTIEQVVEETTPKDEIVAALEQVKARLADTSAKFNKPILFIETGVTNVRGCARYPWSHPGAHMESPLDEQEQANYYAAFFEVFWDEPWFMGYAWWDWPARLYDAEDAGTDRGFSIYGKKAEDILRDWYAR